MLAGVRAGEVFKMPVCPDDPPVLIRDGDSLAEFFEEFVKG
ncbi:hypothetical protein [Methanofollis fontis]|nr:hypothetical protein [Methanofollis fontis]